MRVMVDNQYTEVQTVTLEQNEDGEYFVKLIDQRKLPHKLEFIQTIDTAKLVQLISDMAVRGAPAIGATGAFGYVLGIQKLNEIQPKSVGELVKKINAARPTAKDLDTFLTSMQNFTLQLSSYDLDQIAEYARALAEQSKEECRLIGEHGKSLIKENMKILTHCNAGALATVDYGTALAPMRLAHYDGVNFKVYVDETRPRLQGMLTAWELLQEGINHEIIVDNAAGFYMQQGMIDLVITGTDRVLKDGTVTNKIGTLEKAVLAHHFGIPVYIAMPWTTFDPDTKTATRIPIEYRSENEISEVQGEKMSVRVTPNGSNVSNPAFDITPPEFITGYITKDGIIKAEELLIYYNEL